MAKTLDQPSLYVTDYVAWLSEQVAHLRDGDLQELDIENVALELESLLRQERRQLENRLEVLIRHLLKWDYQPDRRSNDGASRSTSSARASGGCFVTAQA